MSLQKSFFHVFEDHIKLCPEFRAIPEKSAQVSLDYYSEGIRGRKHGHEIISSSEFELNDKLTVPAKTFMIIELR